MVSKQEVIWDQNGFTPLFQEYSYSTVNGRCFQHTIKLFYHLTESKSKKRPRLYAFRSRTFTVEKSYFYRLLCRYEQNQNLSLSHMLCCFSLECWLCLIARAKCPRPFLYLCISYHTQL